MGFIYFKSLTVFFNTIFCFSLVCYDENILCLWLLLGLSLNFRRRSLDFSNHRGICSIKKPKYIFKKNAVISTYYLIALLSVEEMLNVLSPLMGGNKIYM